MIMVTAPVDLLHQLKQTFTLILIKDFKFKTKLFSVL